MVLIVILQAVTKLASFSGVLSNLQKPLPVGIAAGETVTNIGLWSDRIDALPMCASVIYRCVVWETRK